MLTSIAVPVVVDGKSLGVVGVDIALSAQQELVGSVKPYGTGSATLVTTGGAVVASGAGYELGKPASEVSQSLADAVSSGTAAGSRVSEWVDGDLSIAVPISLTESDTWNLVVTVPESSILADATAPGTPW